MKKKSIVLITAFWAAMTFIGCSGSSINGTWVDEDGDEWKFNNGSLSITDEDGDVCKEGTYTISGNVLTITGGLIANYTFNVRGNTLTFTFDAGTKNEETHTLTKKQEKPSFNIGGKSALVGRTATDRALVGRWTDVEGILWEFKTDGTLFYANRPGDSREYRYSVFDGERRTELTIFKVRGVLNEVLNEDQTYTMEYSKDRKTLRLTGGKNRSGWSVAGPGWGTNQLTKK